MDAQTTIEDFLAFRDKHQNRDMEVLAATGILTTRGCDGMYGTCCSHQFDLTLLEDALRELVGKKP